MHGCSSMSVFLVNAEVDSMGGVVEGGVGVACRTSPVRATIEKIQGELRQEYNVRDKTKRELEFLEEGGDPLDLLRPGDAASASVQSTSFTNQHQDHLVTSKAKGSFAFTASPHGDSVESSGRLGTNPCEPNSADNLMLFDGEHEFSEGDRRLLHPSSSNIFPSEKLSQIDGNDRTWKHGDSAAFSVPRKAYKRRNRSRANRDTIRLSSVDINTTHGSHNSSLPSHHCKDLKELITDTENQNISRNCDSKSICPKDVGETGATNEHQDMELDGGKTVESSKNLLEHVMVEAASDAIVSETPLDDRCNQQSQSGPLETPNQIISIASEAIQTTREMSFAVIGTVKIDNEFSSRQINGICSEKDGTNYDAHKTTDLCGVKVLDSEPSCAQTSKCIDENNDGHLCHKMTNADSNGRTKDQTLLSDGTPVVESVELVQEKGEKVGLDGCALDNTESTSTCLMQQESEFKQQQDEELNGSGSAKKSEVKNQTIIEAMEPCEPSGSESGTKPELALNGNAERQDEITRIVENRHSIDTSISIVPKDELTRNSTVCLDAQTSSCSNSKLHPEIDEDSILKEAKVIEAKRKRIAELSVLTPALKIRPRSQWDFVLEEMSWMANDFAQERIWKIAAAAQISSRAAFTCQLRNHEKNGPGMEAKKVAHTLAKSIKEFWHLVEATSEFPKQKSQRDEALPLQAYAARFLKHNNSNIIDNRAEVPLTPNRVSDLGILDLSWEDNLTEENLFYTVRPGAMETYKISIESQVAQCQKIGYRVQEEVGTSAYDVTADFEYQDTAYEDDDGEINTYDISMAFDRSKSSRFGRKKRKYLKHAYGVRSYEVTSNLLPMQYAENKVPNPLSALTAKRPGGSLNVSIPTKRVRTASRRVITPFSAGTSGCIQLPNNTDASSGDTNSFQDDYGSFVPNSSEVDSAGDFRKQSPFHSAELGRKHKKKKKKAKHLRSAAYEPRWQVGTTFQMEQFQRDNLKKNHQVDSNGNSGLYGQPMMKKPKLMWPLQDNSFENIAPVAGSAPYPVASQMSNMSNPNKFIKMLGGRDRGRKPKAMKMPNGQLGLGSPWTLFEDQALVVLVHDLGPNWELVGDAINSTLQLKFIFRKAKECKERHNFLMDRTSGDGADSAEDSGSSQPYPSSLPGIPKGSARQLFQRLQGPMEEETLKSHFEKIIVIGQKQQYRRNQDPRQLQQPHGSHTVSLSQVCPNNLNGGPVLTPLDLCDATITGPDILPLGYQGPHPSGLAIADQGPATQMHPASGASSALQGSPNMMFGNNFSSSPASLSPSMRDGRYIVPKSASADGQQRMHQYNPMMTNRNVPQSNLSPSGPLPGSDRGVRVLPGSRGMGLVSGVDRSMPMARPGFQGVASPPIVSSVPSTNTHSGVGSGQGSSMLRPREPLHLQGQMISPELHMQVSPGNSQVPHLRGLGSPFPNQTASPPVSSYPLHHQPSHPISPQQPQVLSPHHPHFQGPTNHAPNPQQQAYAIRLAKERQHRLLQQQQNPVQPQQQQFSGSSSLMPHVQSQSQLPISPTVQNSAQVQQQTGLPPVSLTSASSLNSIPQHLQKHQTPGQGVVRNAQAGGSGVTNQTGKQRHRQQQQLSQANRPHPQQRQQPQSQQPAKVAKGIGRGSLMKHQNIPVDPSLVNGVSTSPVNQSSKKGETSTDLMSNQVSHAGSTLATVQQTASTRTPNQFLTQQKNSPGQAGQGQVPAVPPGLSSCDLSGATHQKLVNQNQMALQRPQPIRQMNSDPSKPQSINSDADQHPTSSSSEMVARTKLPQTAGNATNVEMVVSSVNTHQLHASGPSVEAHTINSATNTTVSVPANSGESSIQVGPGLDQRPLARLPSSKHDISAHFQQHQQSSQHPQPNSAEPQPQQLPPPLHSQQGQLLQASEGNLYGRSTDHSLE